MLNVEYKSSHLDLFWEVVAMKISENFPWKYKQGSAAFVNLWVD